MWFAFIDESGSTVIKPEIVKKEPLFVLTATMVHEKELIRLNKMLNNFINLINKNYNINIKELHTKNIYHGNNWFKKLDLNDRKNILSDLINIISNSDIIIISVVLYKDKIIRNTDNKINRDDILKLGYKLLSERIAFFISRKENNEFMIWIIDNTQNKLNQKICKIIFNEILNEFRKYKIARQKILLPPIFANSIYYPGLQISDIVGYIISRYIRYKEYYSDKDEKFPIDCYFEKISRKFDTNPNGNYIGYGLKKWYGKIIIE